MARELIAAEPAFYRGTRLERGQKFEFFGEKTPRWAIEPKAPLPPAKEDLRVDTKPPAAAKAAKAKAASIAAANLGGADEV
jgi:hypothetical protein